MISEQDCAQLVCPLIGKYCRTKKDVEEFINQIRDLAEASLPEFPRMSQFRIQLLYKIPRSRLTRLIDIRRGNSRGVQGDSARINPYCPYPGPG